MDETLKLNDGTELIGHAIEASERLFVYIWEKTMAEVFELLNDPEKTKKIIATRYEDQQTFRGYKHLCSVSEETGGMIAASLKKG